MIKTGQKFTFRSSICALFQGHAHPAGDPARERLDRAADAGAARLGDGRVGHQGGARGGQGRALAREHAAGDGDGGGGDQGGARQGHFGRGRAEGERGVAGGGGNF